MPWVSSCTPWPTTFVGFWGLTLVIPMTVLVEDYWHEISDGLADHGIPVHHFVLHADQETLRDRIAGENSVSSTFRLRYLEPYAEAARTWLHEEAEAIDTSHITQARTAALIAAGVHSAHTSRNAQ